MNDNEIAATISVPVQHFINWYDLKAKGVLTETFVEILNACIFKHGLKLYQNDRIEGLLRRICGEVKHKRKKLRGRVNQEFLLQCKRNPNPNPSPGK